MSEPKIHIFAVCGPTASGKSSLAMSLAQQMDCEIISCDSMQIYRNMNIGTAKDSPEERRLVPHHLIDIRDPNEAYSCADYASDARDAIREIVARGKRVMFCGGTGLYLDSALHPDRYAFTGGDPHIREELEEKGEKNGDAYLYSMLKRIDPESAESIHPNNKKRVIRALEIVLTTGKKKSDWDAESLLKTSPYFFHPLVLSFSDRQLLYDRIDSRVDAMIDSGLIDEVKRIKNSTGFGETSSQAIGYKEILLYLDGQNTKEEAISAIKQNTRRYAKRQTTWFGRKKWETLFVDSIWNEKEIIVKKSLNYFSKYI